MSFDVLVDMLCCKSLEIGSNSCKENTVSHLILSSYKQNNLFITSNYYEYKLQSLKKFIFQLNFVICTLLECFILTSNLQRYDSQHIKGNDIRESYGQLLFKICNGGQKHNYYNFIIPVKFCMLWFIVFDGLSVIAFILN